MTLIELLREFGTDADLIALAERFLSPGEGTEPLTDEELDQLQAGLIALGDDEEASGPLLGLAADAVEAVRAEQTSRDETAATEEAERQAAIARLRGEDDPDATDPDGDTDTGDDDDGDPVDGDTDDGDPAEATDEATDAEPVPEPVAAAARATARRSLARRRPRSAAPAEDQPGAHRIEFAADVPRVRPGDRAQGMADVNRAIRRRFDAFGRSKAQRKEQIPVATIYRDFPEDRRLMDSGGRLLAPDAAAERVETVLAAALANYQANGQGALTAAGGLCVPPTPIYSVQTLGELSRPIRDTALTSFQLTRGAVVSIAPPVLTQVAGALSFWTMEDDVDALDPEGPVKPCDRIECGVPRETEMEALVRCLTFGNIMARTFSEWTDAWSQLVMVAQDRIAEQRLFQMIVALSTSVSLETTVYSATRDILDVLDRAAWGMRSRHRAGRNFPFRAILPDILHGILRTDIARSLPGGSPAGNLVIADAELDRFFASRNINVTWSPDLVVVGPQGATALADWPPVVPYAIYPEGTHLHLDAGELDLGLQRDPVLNERNDAQMFAETFEAVHMLGVESIAGTVNVCPSGAVAGTRDPAPICATYT